MKVNVEVTCTPEEARAFFGLPDIKPMQDRIMGEIEERLKSSLNSMNPEQVFNRHAQRKCHLHQRRDRHAARALLVALKSLPGKT